MKQAFDSLPKIRQSNYVAGMHPPTLSSAKEEILEITHKRELLSCANLIEYNFLSASMLHYIQNKIRKGQKFIFYEDSEGSGVYSAVSAILMDLKTESHLYSPNPNPGVRREEYLFLRSHSFPETWRDASGIKVLIDLSSEISSSEMISLIESVSPQIIVTNRRLYHHPRLSEVLFENPVSMCTLGRYFDGSRRIQSMREVRKSMSGEYLESRMLYYFDVKSFKYFIEGEFMEFPDDKFQFYF